MASSEITTSGVPRKPVGGRTRWRRVAAMLGSATLAGAVLVVLTAQGVLAAQFAISGIPFTVASSHLDGTGFEQFGFLDNMAPNSPNAGDTGGQVFVVVSVIGNAQLADLCQSINLGGTNLKITAGGATPVKATTLIADSVDVTGNFVFSNFVAGQDASTLTAVPGVTGPLGDFGQQADTVTISNLRQTNFATTAAAFTLPNLHLSFDTNAC
jgi:Family of unknown function (DUF6230)